MRQKKFFKYGGVPLSSPVEFIIIQEPHNHRPIYIPDLCVDASPALICLLFTNWEPPLCVRWMELNKTAGLQNTKPPHLPRLERGCFDALHTNTETTKVIWTQHPKTNTYAIIEKNMICEVPLVDPQIQNVPSDKMMLEMWDIYKSHVTVRKLSYMCCIMEDLPERGSAAVSKKLHGCTKYWTSIQLKKPWTC